MIADSKGAKRTLSRVEEWRGPIFSIAKISQRRVFRCVCLAAITNALQPT